MQFKLNNKGSVSIEAAIALVITMSAVLTLSLFARVAYVQGVVQHALVQTANELATYSYFYSLTGLNQINNAVVQKTLKGKEPAENAAEKVEKAITNVSDVYTKFTGKDYSGAASGVGAAGSAVKDLGSIDIKETLKGFCAAVGGELFEEGKTTALNEVTRMLMETYLPADKAKFYKLGMFAKRDGSSSVSDFSVDSYKHVTDGKFPIDLSYSSYFSNAEGDEILLVAVYDLKLVTPIPIINRPITIAQTAKARAWMAEWKPATTDSSTSVWDLSYTERAKKIKSTNSKLNLPDNFECLAGFESSSGTASMFITIDVRNKTYSGKQNAIKNQINTKLTKLANFKSDKNSGIEVKQENIKSVNYYVYIPKDATAAQKADARAAASSLSNPSFELENGTRVPVNVIVKEI